MILSISHKTSYSYASPLGYGLQQLRIKPSAGKGQKILNWNIELVGASKQAEFLDQHNNCVWLTKFDLGAEEVSFTCTGQIETEDCNGIIGPNDGLAPLWLFKHQTALTKPGTNLLKFIKKFATITDNPLQELHTLSAAIVDYVPYQTGTTSTGTTAEEAIKLQSGVCQDHTHIMLGIARHLGYPARYVSGYLMMDDRIDQDAGHAWAEIYLDNLGWVGFDVSNGISPDARYVRIATGLDYLEAAPVTGVNYRLHGASDQNNMVVNIQVQQ